MIDTAEPKPDFSVTEPRFHLAREAHIYFDRAHQHRKNADDKLAAIARQYARGAGELLTGGGLIASGLSDLLEKRADFSSWLKGTMGGVILSDASIGTYGRIKELKHNREMFDLPSVRSNLRAGTKDIDRLFESLIVGQDPDRGKKRLDQIKLDEKFKGEGLHFMDNTIKLLNQSMLKRLSLNPDSAERYDLVDIKAELLAWYRVHWAEEIFRQNYTSKTEEVLDGNLSGTKEYYVPPKEAQVYLPVEIKDSASLVDSIKLLSREASELSRGSYAREDRICFLESVLLGQLHASHFLFFHPDSQVQTLVQPLLESNEAILQALVKANPSGIGDYKVIITNYIESTKNPRKYCEFFPWKLEQSELLDQFEQEIKGIFS